MKNMRLESSVSRNIIIFFNLDARKFHFLKWKKFFRGGFFYFFELGLKNAPGSTIYNYFQIFLIVIVLQKIFSKLVWECGDNIEDLPRTITSPFVCSLFQIIFEVLVAHNFSLSKGLLHYVMR